MFDLNNILSLYVSPHTRHTMLYKQATITTTSYQHIQYKYVEPLQGWQQLKWVFMKCQIQVIVHIPAHTTYIHIRMYT